MMFYLNFPDNKDDVEAYATKPTLVITNERTLYITAQYKKHPSKEIDDFDVIRPM